MVPLEKPSTYYVTVLFEYSWRHLNVKPITRRLHTVTEENIRTPKSHVTVPLRKLFPEENELESENPCPLK